MPSIDGIYYEERGSGDPVLLVHGSIVADAMLPLANEPGLSEKYRLIRHHRRGLGKSARHDGPWSIEQQAGDALAVLRAADVSRCHVVGYSYGAVTAIEIALQAPDVARSLVLLEPPLMTAEQAATTSAELAPLLDAYESAGPAAAVDAFMSAIGGADWRNVADAAVPGASEVAEADAPAFFEVEFQAMSRWHFEAAKGARITAPVLHVLGRESGELFERPRELLQSSVPHLETADLDGMNHLLVMKDPRSVARAVEDFLDRHPL